MKERIDISKIASGNPKSKWKKNLEAQFENKSWLDLSFDIALKILDRLEELGKSQKWLAGKLDVSPQQVSKLVKGKENLTLETIYKLNSALGITLVEVAKEEKSTSVEWYRNMASHFELEYFKELFKAYKNIEL